MCSTQYGWRPHGYNPWLVSCTEQTLVLRTLPGVRKLKLSWHMEYWKQVLQTLFSNVLSLWDAFLVAGEFIQKGTEIRKLFSYHDAIQYRGCPAKRALPVMLTHGRQGPFGRIPSIWSHCPGGVSADQIAFISLRCLRRPSLSRAVVYSGDAWACNSPYAWMNY